MKIKFPKIVSDPLWGLIDISGFLPMIDTADFQSLGYKYQLGFSFLIFPAATHTRKQHSLGAFQRTTRLAGDWVERGFITADQARTLRAYALYHDLGHGPFSHTTESIFHIDHDEIGLLKMRRRQKEIEASGVDFAALEKMFTREDPLYLAVFDKNVGMEKMDYLSRDAFYTIKEVPGVDYLTKFIYYVDNQVVVDEKAIDQARALQDFYMKMYKHVYLRKKSIIAQRYVEKMTFELYEEGLKEEEIWSLTDFGLMGKFELSKNKTIQTLYERLMKNDLPKTAVELRFGKFVSADMANLKKIAVYDIEDGAMNRLLQHELLKTPKGFKQLESDLARIVGLPSDDILLVPPVFPASNLAKRFEPSDVNVYRFDNSIGKLSDFYPSHFEAMREYGKSHHAIRFCVPADKREAVSKKGEAVRDYLLGLTK